MMDGSGVPCAGAFRWVITSRTPGELSAPDMSICVMRPLPIVAQRMKP
jgi:hypothetical protein